MAWGLLHWAAAHGARLVDATATAFHEEGGRVTIETDTPHVIEARHTVLATGYVMPGFIMPEIHKIASSWAVATVPQAPDALWPERALIWEASEPYLYLRTTADNRIVIGGEDEAIDDPALRDSKLRPRPKPCAKNCAACGRQQSRRSPMPGAAPSAKRKTACR